MKLVYLVILLLVLPIVSASFEVGSDLDSRVPEVTLFAEPQTFDNATAFVNNSHFWQGFIPETYQSTYINGSFIPFLGASLDADMGLFDFNATIGGFNQIWTSQLHDQFTGGQLDMSGDPWSLAGVDFEVTQDLIVGGDTDVQDILGRGTGSFFNQTLLISGDSPISKDANATLWIRAEVNFDACINLTESQVAGISICYDGTGSGIFEIRNYREGTTYMTIDSRDSGLIEFFNNTLFDNNVSIIGNVTADNLNLSGLLNGVNISNLSGIYVPYNGAVNNVDLGIFNFTTTGKIGIGAPAVIFPLEIDGNDALAKIKRYRTAGVTNSPAFLFVRSRGTQSSPADAEVGDWLGKIQFRQGTSTASENNAGFLGFVLDDVAGQRNGYFTFADGAANEVFNFNTGTHVVNLTDGDIITTGNITIDSDTSGLVLGDGQDVKLMSTSVGQLRIGRATGAGSVVVQLANGVDNVGIMQREAGSLAPLKIVGAGGVNASFFTTSADGRTRNLRIYGFPTGVALGFGQFKMIDDAFQITSDRGEIDFDDENLHQADNAKHFWGASDDASIYYNGSDLFIDTQEVGSGNLLIPNGMVGVGVTPTVPFHLSSTSNVIVRFVSTDQFATMRIEDPGGYSEFGVDNGIVTISSAAAGRIMTMRTSGDVGIGTTNPKQKFNVFGGLTNLSGLIVEGDVNITGNVTAENVFLPQEVFAHTNRTVALNVANQWFNISFDHHEDLVKKGIIHTFNDATNDTFIINQTGDYMVHYSGSFVDASPSPTSNFGLRIIKNSVEVMGSVIEFDTSRQDAENELGNAIIVLFVAGDEIKLQAIGDDVDISITTHGTFGDDPETTTLSIFKISNI